MIDHSATQPQRRSGIAGWWYARRARAHGRYLRKHVLVAVPAHQAASRERYAAAA